MGTGAVGTGAVGIVTVTLQAKASDSQKRPRTAPEPSRLYERSGISLRFPQCAVFRSADGGAEDLGGQVSAVRPTRARDPPGPAASTPTTLRARPKRARDPPAGGGGAHNNLQPGPRARDLRNVGGC